MDEEKRAWIFPKKNPLESFRYPQIIVSYILWLILLLAYPLFKLTMVSRSHIASQMFSSQRRFNITRWYILNWHQDLSIYSCKISYDMQLSVAVHFSLCSAAILPPCFRPYSFRGLVMCPQTIFMEGCVS